MQWVASVDLLQNDFADANVLISSSSDWVGQGQEVSDFLPGYESNLGLLVQFIIGGEKSRRYAEGRQAGCCGVCGWRLGRGECCICR